MGPTEPERFRSENNVSEESASEECGSASHPDYIHKRIFTERKVYRLHTGQNGSAGENISDVDD